MKKYLLNLTTILMVAIMSGGFVSCGDDDDNPAPMTNAGVLDKNSGLRVLSVGYYTFEYDSKGRINYVSEDSYYGYKFTYNPNKMISEHHGEEERSYTVGYNGNGYISSLSYNDSDEDRVRTGTVTFSYDAEGHLTQVSETCKKRYYDERSDGSWQYTCTMTWKNGRLTKAVDKYKEEEDGEYETATLTCTFNYSDYAMENYYNKYLQIPPSIILRTIEVDGAEFMAYVGLLGNGPKYLPSSAELVEVENENGKEKRKERFYSFSYGFNTDGSLSYCNDNGTHYSYSYTHSSGADSHKAPSVMQD